MGDVTGVAVIWARRCGSGARYGAPADRRTDASTTPAARDRANYSPSAGADQTAAQRPIGGVVGSAKTVVASINPAPITLAIVACFVICVLPRSQGSGAGLLIRFRSRSSSARHLAGQTNGAELLFQFLPRRRVCPTRCRVRSRLRPAPPPNEEACAHRATLIHRASAGSRSRWRPSGIDALA
jgi:hypothetical protein